MGVLDDLWKVWPQRAFPCGGCPSTRSGNLHSRSGPGRTCQVFTRAPRPLNHQPHPRAADRHAHKRTHPITFQKSQGGRTCPPEDGCACVTMPHRWGWSEGAKPRCVCRTICGRFGRSGRSPAEVVLPPVRATSAASPAPDGPPRFSPQPRAPQVISPTQGRRTDMHTHTHTFHYISKVPSQGNAHAPQKMA